MVDNRTERMRIRFKTPGGGIPVGSVTLNLPRDGGTPAFPVLTEDMGFAPSTVAPDTGGRSGGGGPGGSFGPTVAKALQDVLGWKVKPNDARGFVGALNQSFDLTLVEGSIVSTWTPRSYAVQTDLSGGITGAQASIYTMANTLLDQMLPLIDGLTPLDPACDLPDVTANKTLIKNQLKDLAAEIGYLGGPRVMRVHQYFQMLTGVSLKLDLQAQATVAITSGRPALDSPLHSLFPNWPPVGIPAPWTNPDMVLGSLGELRDLMGLFQDPQESFINTVEDEQNVTNFRIVVDYAGSLLAAWTNNIQFFAGAGAPFLGTQLVWISRQLGVISEVIDEVRFLLDSVLIGAAQRESLLLDFANQGPIQDVFGDGDESRILAPIYLEDLLGWIQNFVTVEAPPVIQDAGRLGVGSDFVEMIAELCNQAYALYLVATTQGGALGAARVVQALIKLVQRLYDLRQTALPVSRAYIPPRP